MKKIPPRKRLSKKDRHSKITTARGVRDRRMRLSLPVAQQFFGLQDLLGVDKGSKTVEWLLIQAKPEILKLARERSSNHFIMNNNASNYSAFSNSSELDEVGVIIGDQDLNTNDNNIKIKKKKKKKKMRSNKQLPRKTMAKELREKARERARARTLEKKNQIFIKDSCSDHPNFSKIISSSSWSSPFETTVGEESAGTQSYNNNNLNLAIEVEKPITNSQFDYQFHQSFSSFDIILPKSSPSDDSTFNFLHQQHEFEDSDIFG